MICERCGRNEASFHFSSNINGSITQTRLCSLCAAQVGLNMFGGVASYASRPQVSGHQEGHKSESFTRNTKKLEIVDEEMKERRLINAQMKEAVDSENFELAATLRNQLRQLESRED